MNAETILRSDLLDILFENRNKQYGAYELRRGYDNRLLKALAIIMSSVVLLFIWDYIQHHRKNNGQSNVSGIPMTDTVKLAPYEIPNKPPPPPKTAPPAASITNPPPVIVPDQLVKDSMHTVDDMVNKVISDVTAPGLPSTSDNQTAALPASNTVVVNADPPGAPEPAIIDNPGIMPEFPGGTAALLRFLGKNLQVPEDALEPGQRVQVPVKFVVNKEGNLSDIVFLTEADNVFKKEILRVVAKMPKWKPGSQHGKTVAVYFTIPVIFDMTEN